MQPISELFLTPLMEEKNTVAKQLGRKPNATMSTELTALEAALIVHRKK